MVVAVMIRVECKLSKYCPNLLQVSGNEANKYEVVTFLQNENILQFIAAVSTKTIALNPWRVDRGCARHQRGTLTIFDRTQTFFLKVGWLHPSIRSKCDVKRKLSATAAVVCQIRLQLLLEFEMLSLVPTYRPFWLTCDWVEFSWPDSLTWRKKFTPI